jgi:tetratricopeptide (TPR) repeat protein
MRASRGIANRAVIALVIAGFAWASPGYAGSEADALFRDGRDLLEKGRWLEACEKLQKSEKLAPAVGTLLNLGYCWEQLGRTRSAMDAYAEAEILASEAGDAKSATFARERFTAVEAKVMRLMIRVEKDSTPGLEIARNGQPVPKTDWGKPIAVDQEDFIVTAVAPGYVAWKGVVAAKGEAAVVTLVVPPLEKVSAVLAKDPIAGLGTKRMAALGVGAGALVAFGAGTALALSAKSRHDDAEPLCDPSGCDPAGSRIKSSAVDQGNVATVLFAAGFVCLGTAVYLWLSGGPERASTAWRLPLDGRVRF